MNRIVETFTRFPVSGVFYGSFKFYRNPKLLSASEMEVLALAAIGCTNQGIATRLSPANPTVRTQLAKIFRKIYVDSRAEAAVKYLSSKTERMIEPANL